MEKRGIETKINPAEKAKNKLNAHPKPNSNDNSTSSQLFADSNPIALINSNIKRKNLSFLIIIEVFWFWKKKKN